MKRRGPTTPVRRSCHRSRGLCACLLDHARSRAISSGLARSRAVSRHGELRVEAEAEQHREEEQREQRGDGQLGDRLRVDDEREAGPLDLHLVDRDACSLIVAGSWSPLPF